ncbi:MAG: NnrS family protein [Leptospiraceae bacterium]|nr:NnrS family protein [Leptospiraceae bacterium]
MTVSDDRHYLEPYRLLFPIALLGSAITVGIWMLTALGRQTHLPVPLYPAALHAYGVFAAFVFPAVSGFLLTAVPRFTGSTLPHNGFSFTVALFYMLSLLSFILGEAGAVCLFAFLGLLSTLIFAVRRFRRSSVKLPLFLFAFIPTGLLFAAIGWLLILIPFALEKLHVFGLPSLQVDFPFDLVGRTMVFYYSISLIVLGAGSRIAVTIQASDHEDKNEWRRTLEGGRMEAFLVASLIILGFLLEFLGILGEESRGGYLRRAGGFLSFAAMFYWLVLRFRIYRMAFRRAIATGIRAAFWMILIGLMLRSLLATENVHWAHLFFAGGLALLTISVMTRVVLSHGKWDLEPENRSPFLWITIVLILLAAATRASAHLLPASYINHLGYAAFLFVLGVLIWLLRFLVATLKQKS